MRPSRSSMAARICWMRRAFWSAIPPQRIASATSVVGASATCSQVGNLSFSRANARSELTSEVCCDRTVATTSSMTGSRGLGMKEPWWARSRRCTSLMPSWLGAAMIHSFCPRPAGAVTRLWPPGSSWLDHQDPGTEADGQRPGYPSNALGWIVRGYGERARPGFGVPDPHRAVVTRAGQQLPSGHRDLAHVVDLGPVAFQHDALLAGRRIPDPHRAVGAGAGQQLLPGHDDGAHRPQ